MRDEGLPSLDSPFIPGVEFLKNRVAMDGILYDPNEKPTGNYILYNAQNLYGTQQTMATNEYLTSRDNRRPLVVSRCNFIGHARHGTVWSGDNESTQKDMELSVPSIMKHSQLGIPFTGSDVCGFHGDVSEGLCARWAQVGAFYPFMRNHYNDDYRPQEFYTFDDSFTKGIKESLRQRYSLLRNYYTELYKSSRYGYSTVRHPMYDWPEIDEIIKDKNSFMIGKSIRVVANFALDDTTPLKTYMPKGRWLDYQTYILFKLGEGSIQEIYNGWDYTNVHIRGGSIISFQNTSVGSGIHNTYGLLESNLKLLIVPNDNHYAYGNLYISRGETTNETFQYFSLTYSNKKLQFRLDDGMVTKNGSESNEVLDEIQIVDDDEDVLASDFACAIMSNHNIRRLIVSVESKTEKSQTYLKISSSEQIQFDEIHAIVFGKTGLDENICDKSYHVILTQSTNLVNSYTLKKANSTTNDKELTLTLKLLEHENIQLTITDGSDRFIVPKSSLKDGGPNLKTGAHSTIDDYVKVSNSTTKFTLKIHEFQNPDSVYFEIDEDSLIFSEYYLSLETEINSNGKIYGIGQRTTDFFIQDGIYTSWAFDQPDQYDDGTHPGKNMYGVHPVYFTRSNTGTKSHWGMFNLNANAQDTKVEHNTGKHGAKISHYISGQGIFDIYFFIDNSNPEDTIKKYHSIIGNTLLPPFWSLGWNQYMLGNKSTSAIKDVFKNYTSFDIPLDTLWSDADHMLKLDDTSDKKDLDRFIKETLHKDHRKFVPIINAGIPIIKDNSSVYINGKQKEVFIKSHTTNDTLYGKTKIGYVAYPDWTTNLTLEWWLESIQEFYKEIEFDGIWLNMNEASNLCNGTCIIADTIPPGESVLGKLVYSPGSRCLNEKSLSVDGKHSDGNIELNYHSLFGLMQGEATNKYFSNQHLKPLIVSRSTFAGQGKFTSHWLGDKNSKFDSIKYSISGIMSMNVFGINFVGADVCSNLNQTTEDLCLRWMKVGAFYPLARGHDDLTDVLGKESNKNTSIVMRYILRLRYTLLRYFYTQMYLASENGGTLWKPLFFEFPEEIHAYSDIERNIMIGPSIKFSPMIDNSSDKSQFFIMPAGRW